MLLSLPVGLPYETGASVPSWRGANALGRAVLQAVGVPALGELLDDLVAEGGQVVGAAARHEPLIDDDLLVDHVRARIAQVGSQARERRDAPSGQDAGLEQRPGPVADGADRLAGVEEVT